MYLLNLCLPYMIKIQVFNRKIKIFIYILKIQIYQPDGKADKIIFEKQRFSAFHPPPAVHPDIFSGSAGRPGKRVFLKYII
jgi:hypothetical protein